MRDKRKLKVHWVNGVENLIKTKQTKNQTTQYKKNQTTPNKMWEKRRIDRNEERKG